MAKERLQEPVVGDEINLRLFPFNSNNPADLYEIDRVEIWFLDPELKSESNPDGRRLVETYPGTDVTHVETGEYLLTISTSTPTYTIGNYVDIWYSYYEEWNKLEDIIGENEHQFQILPDLWYTTSLPVVYDFDFRIMPNRLRQGSIQELSVEIIPNVPRASDLAKFYENIAIVSDLTLSMEMYCGECIPQEKDLRTVFENQPVDHREKCYGYYQLDTTDLDKGIYNIWATLEYGGNKYVGDNQQLQIYD